MKATWLIANPIPHKSTSCNKDLNGGYGTCDEIGDSLSSKILAKIKKRSIKLPVLSLAYISSSLKEKSHSVIYSESYEDCIHKLRSQKIDGCIIYSSIVATKYECKLIEKIKKLNKEILILVVGSFSTNFTSLYEKADHIIMGEPEDFFSKWNGKINELRNKGKYINSKEIICLDEFPIPDFKEMGFRNFSYQPMLKKPTGFIEASRGCPYSCGYYCTYGANQGKLIRSYTPKRIVEIMINLKNKYGFRSFQFRDPVFGLQKNFIDDFCNEILNASINIDWGIETRADLLNSDKLEKMSKAGLKSINIGIETPRKEIALSSKRVIYDNKKLVQLIKEANSKNIKINGFYILGLEDDTYESCLETIEYSRKLNTFMARYSVATAYPGTSYFEDLDKDSRITEKDLSKYNQQNLVFKHKNLSNNEIKKLISKAYKKYYIRPRIFFMLLKDKIKNSFRS
tara:strand:+ start:6461 stop:7828 length:1368 start_codon:yes stop_codon:yes gene_type:complete